MDRIQKAIERTLFSIPESALGQLFQKKLNEQGVPVSDSEAQQLAKAAMNGKPNFEISRSGDDRSVDMEITKEEVDDLVERIERFMNEDLQNLFLNVQSEVAPKLLRRLKRDWPAQRRWYADVISDFQRNLRRRWVRGLDKLHMLVAIARELGGSMNADLREQASTVGPTVVDVTTRLHARACQIAEEVLVLLEAGFADGALGRWRTMHEVCVTATFVSNSGEECARAYSDHQAVESKRGSDEYARIHERLGYPPIPKRDVARIEAAFNRAVKKHGEPFKTQYGWAAASLNSKRPTFSQIELAVGSDHYRGHYRMASHGVHANPKGIYTSMAASRPNGFLLAGPSNAGLADPGQLTARTLTIISAVLMSLSPVFDHQLGIRVMDLLSNEIGEDLLKAHRKLEDDENRFRRKESQA